MCVYMCLYVYVYVSVRACVGGCVCVCVCVCVWQCGVGINEFGVGSGGRGIQSRKIDFIQGCCCFFSLSLSHPEKYFFLQSSEKHCFVSLILIDLLSLSM